MPDQPVNRILIIRPSALGDVCRTVPVLATLRHGFPDAVIDWIVQSEFVDAVRAHPALDEVIPFPRHHYASWWRNPVRFGKLAGWFRMLRRRKYDLVLDCQGLGRSGVMSLATGAGTRVGWSNAREVAHLAYTMRIDISNEQHTVDQMMALPVALGLKPVADMRLHVQDEHDQWWQQMRRAIDIADEPYAVLAPTARWPSKCWPEDRFVTLIDSLRECGVGRFVLIGAPRERTQVPRLADLARNDRAVIDVMNDMTIGRSMAVIASSSLVIANDSAPLHMAVGFDRPLVGLFGPTDPRKVGPYGRLDFVARPPEASLPPNVEFKDRSLGDSVMRLISVDQVMEIAQRAMTLARVKSAE